MKSDRSIHAELNKCIGVELIAINQYFLHARMLKNWGYESLADHVYHASIAAMRETDRLIERILFLEGLPNLQNLGKLLIGQNVPEILKSDLTLETSVRNVLVAATEVCEKASDFVSRALIAEIQEASEERIDYLETQQELLQEMGLPNYLQLIAHPED